MDTGKLSVEFNLYNYSIAPDNIKGNFAAGDS